VMGPGGPVHSARAKTGLTMQFPRQKGTITIPIGMLSREPPASWKVYSDAAGRKYYFNKITKQSVWVKPQELAEAERLQVQTRTQEEHKSGELTWKEHTAANGKKYYYNTVTKQSTWTMPPEFKKEIGRILEAKGELSALEQALRRSKEEIADLENKPVSVGGVVRTGDVDPTAMAVAAVTEAKEEKEAVRITSWTNKEESTQAFLQLLQ